jgi:Uma2 family endonuclease
MSAQLEKRHFNVDEYYRMGRAGILKPDDRVELIEGDIIRMSPIGSSHAACVSRLDRLLQKANAPKATIWVQNPVRLNDFSEPVPDIAVLKPRNDFYGKRHPTPVDVLLVIEVADTTILSDRNLKGVLYAQAGIREFWLVNVRRKIIEVYFDPVDGRYRKSLEFRRREVVVSPSISALRLKVSDIVG